MSQGTRGVRKRNPNDQYKSRTVVDDGDKQGDEAIVTETIKRKGLLRPRSLPLETKSQIISRNRKDRGTRRTPPILPATRRDIAPMTVPKRIYKAVRFNYVPKAIQKARRIARVIIQLLRISQVILRRFLGRETRDTRERRTVAQVRMHRLG